MSEGWGSCSRNGSLLFRSSGDGPGAAVLSMGVCEWSGIWPCRTRKTAVERSGAHRVRHPPLHQPVAILHDHMAPGGEPRSGPEDGRRSGRARSARPRTGAASASERCQGTTVLSGLTCPARSTVNLSSSPCRSRVHRSRTFSKLASSSVAMSIEAHDIPAQRDVPTVEPRDAATGAKPSRLGGDPFATSPAMSPYRCGRPRHVRAHDEPEALEAAIPTTSRTTSTSDRGNRVPMMMRA